MFSAPAILLGEAVVGALAYLESRTANADTLLGDTAFVLQGLSRTPPWGAPWPELITDPQCWVPGEKRRQGASVSL